jgi:hypothetical protein
MVAAKEKEEEVVVVEAERVSKRRGRVSKRRAEGGGEEVQPHATAYTQSISYRKVCRMKGWHCVSR